MIQLDYDAAANRLVLTGSYLDRDIIKTINGVKAEGAQRWTLPAAVPCYIEAEMVVKQDNGEIDQTAADWWASLQPLITSLLSLKKEDTATSPVVWGADITLKPEQEADAKFLASVRNGLVLNSMRTGKSFTMLRTLDLAQAFPALIAVPPSTTFEMERQVCLAFPDRSVTVLSSGMTATQRKKALSAYSDIVIAGHNLIPLHARLVSYGGLTAAQRDKERTKGAYEDKELDKHGFAAVVVDEAHRIQNPKAAVTRALWSLGDKASCRLALTGTPAPNSEDEMWSLLRFCYPALFPARGKWLDRYVNMVENFFGIKVCRGMKVETREAWDLIFSLMHVRRQRTAGPSVEHRVIPVELPKEQLKMYRQLAEHSMTEIGDELVTATDSMSLWHKLSQVAGGTPVLSGGEIVSLQMPSAKIDALLEILSENDDKTIVVAESRLLCDLARSVLQDAGYAVVALLGGMKPEERQSACAEFQTGDARVIVINKAGAEGIELSAAKRTVFLQRSFDLTFNAQAEARNTSAAQTEQSVEVVDIYAKGTLDEAVREAYVRKDTALHQRLQDRDWIKLHLYGDI